MTSLYAAPDELLRQFQGAVAPLRPDAGWLGAVIDAIEAGLDEGEEFPWPPGERAGGALVGAGGAERQAAGDGAPQQQQQQGQEGEEGEETEDEETEQQQRQQQQQQEQQQQQAAGELAAAAAESRPQSALGGDGEAAAVAAERAVKARTRKLAQNYTLAAERR